MRLRDISALRSGSAAFAIACAAMSAAPAFAQEASDDGASGVGEIVVTAQRRTESLQKVPISVEVVSQLELQSSNITSFNTLAELNPSIRVRGSGRASNFYIRGTGSGESQSFDQSVGVFIDDIYHGRSRLSEGAFLDLGSGLIDQSQKMTVAARAMAERKTVGHLS